MPEQLKACTHPYHLLQILTLTHDVGLLGMNSGLQRCPAGLVHFHLCFNDVRRCPNAYTATLWTSVHRGVTNQAQSDWHSPAVDQ